ncbi:hypothetical protein [Sphingomonas sp. UYP23]
MIERLGQIPNLEPRTTRDEQRHAADSAAHAHYRGDLEHPIGGERRLLDEAVKPPHSMIVVVSARRFGEPLGNVELALHDIDPIECDEAGRFFVQADQQEVVNAARSRGFGEPPRQHQLAARRHFAQRTANIHLVHRPIPRLRETMVNVTGTSVGIS